MKIFDDSIKKNQKKILKSKQDKITDVPPIK